MRIQKGFKFRIYPNRAQSARLAIQFGHARFVYNHYRALREQVYHDTGQGLTYAATATALTQLKYAPDFA